MNKQTEALKMAIESMEHAGHLAFSVAIQACKEALEQQEARLVSYAPDKSTCTLNIDGEEVYFNRAIHIERSADDESTIA